jgi:hypothetical protein
MERPSKCDGFHQGVLHERCAYLSAGIEEQRKNACREAALACAAGDYLADELACAGMRRVRLHDDRIAGSESGCGVSAGDRKRQRKIAGAKHRDRTHWAQHGSNIWPGQRSSVWLRRINAGINPRAFFD